MYSHPVNVLLVEEDCVDAQRTIRELKRLHLANSLIHVKDGDEALDFLFSTGRFAGTEKKRSLPNIILLDIQMPEMRSLEVLKKIKEDGRTSGTHVILLTPSGEHPDLHDCFELGAISYIVKPLNFERFAQAIHGPGLFWLLLDKAPRQGHTSL